MSETIVSVSRIQKFCTHDGPGVRTTVFLKGCPLRCAWCHNPETRSARAGIMFAEKLCVYCGACESTCRSGVHKVGDRHLFDVRGCTGCGDCTYVCPTGAVEMDSRTMTVAQVLAEVLRDRAFYGAAGGMTLSGGEPMYQPYACIELLKAARASGITTAIETCGCFDPRYIPELAEYVDTFLWDFKDSDSERHRKYTGHTNEHIIRNLHLLDAQQAKIQLRCILVEGVNMTAEHASAIADLYNSLEHCEDVELLPYHAYGSSKAVQAGINVEPHREWIPAAERLEWFAGKLISQGVKLHNR